MTAWKAARPCLTCGRVTHHGSRCPTCQATWDAAHERGRAQRRGTTAQRGYGAAWQRQSRVLRAQGGACERCGTVHDLTVDHLIPLAAGGTSDASNLRVLCRRCNGMKGAR